MVKLLDFEPIFLVGLTDPCFEKKESRLDCLSLLGVGDALGLSFIDFGTL